MIPCMQMLETCHGIESGDAKYGTRDPVPISFFLLGALVLGILAEGVLCQYGYQVNGIFVAEYKRYFLPCCLEL